MELVRNAELSNSLEVLIILSKLCKKPVRIPFHRELPASPSGHPYLPSLLVGAGAWSPEHGKAGIQPSEARKLKKVHDADMWQEGRFLGLLHVLLLLVTIDIMQDAGLHEYALQTLTVYADPPFSVSRTASQTPARPRGIYGSEFSQKQSCMPGILPEV